jgi:hypothetical protein
MGKGGATPMDITRRGGYNVASLWFESSKPRQLCRLRGAVRLSGNVNQKISRNGRTRQKFPQGSSFSSRCAATARLGSTMVPRDWGGGSSPQRTSIPRSHLFVWSCINPERGRRCARSGPKDGSTSHLPSSMHRPARAGCAAMQCFPFPSHMRCHVWDAGNDDISTVFLFSLSLGLAPCPGG